MRFSAPGVRGSMQINDDDNAIAEEEEPESCFAAHSSVSALHTIDDEDIEQRTTNVERQMTNDDATAENEKSPISLYHRLIKIVAFVYRRRRSELRWWFDFSIALFGVAPSPLL